MHRIDSPTAEADKFGSGKDGFTDGSPGVTAATHLTNDWFDGVQEEIVSPIENVGMSLVKGQRDQLLEALRRRSGLFAVGNWERKLPAVSKNERIQGVGYLTGQERWIAVGTDDGVDSYLITSDDAETWTERTNPQNSGLKAVSGESGVAIAVGGPDATDAYIITSSDGAAWTERSNPKAFPLEDIVYASGYTRHVAVGWADGTDAYILTSDDSGATWTERGNPKNLTLIGVGYDSTNDVLVAVGQFEVSLDPYIVRSTDGGVTWSEQSNPGTKVLNGVAYSPERGLWVAVGEQDTNAVILSSPDGVTWSSVTNSIATDLNSVRWIAEWGMFATCGDNGMVYTSFDGSTWTIKYTGTTDETYDLWYAQSRLVLGGFPDGTDARLFRSLASPEL